MMDITQLAKENKLLFYGLTPPKAHLPQDRLEEIAAIQRNRIAGMKASGIVLYDIQDESQRVAEKRPFPFTKTVDPEKYFTDFLQPVVPAVVYHSIGQETEAQFSEWLSHFQGNAMVLVGSPSSDQSTSMSLKKAYRLRTEIKPEIPLGGIVIPERHRKKGDEHLRVWDKMQSGCSFFISQCVYSSESTKNFLSDYHWHLKHYNTEPVPVIFTLTPCGSAQTLRFMQWLGIAVPDWIQNELLFSGNNMLEKSVAICRSIAEDLIGFCLEKELPFGFNIESVSIRKEEIEASVALYRAIKTRMEAISITQRQPSTTGGNVTEW